MDIAAFTWSVAHELGKIRGEVWSTTEGWDQRSRRLRGPGGAALLLREDYRDNRRVSVTGSFPRTGRRAVAPEITASHERGAAAVAKDISRRLLPGYLAELAEVLKYNEVEQANYDARAALLNQMAGIFGGQYGEHRAPYEPGSSTNWRDIMHLRHVPGYHGLGYGSVEASGHPDTVNVELTGLPSEVALALLQRLAELVKPAS
jgi:hypothetical protein